MEAYTLLLLVLIIITIIRIVYSLHKKALNKVSSELHLLKKDYQNLQLRNDKMVKEYAQTFIKFKESFDIKETTSKNIGHDNELYQKFEKKINDKKIEYENNVSKLEQALKKSEQTVDIVRASYNQHITKIRELIQKVSELEEALINNEKEKENNTISSEQNQQTILELNRRIEELVEGYKKKDELYASFKTRDDKLVTKLSSIYTDFMLGQYDISAEYLKTKKRPAFEEAARINALKWETQGHIKHYRIMQYKLEELRQLFPELSAYIDDWDVLKELSEFKSISELQDDYDRVQFYLSPEEYLKLNTDDRNQLALDRYISRSKTKWQIGRDYELFCGLEYEKDGWDVEYCGMEKKLNDMGRDLIAKKINTHLIIQCKYWSQEKTIHEKHITQLYGTTIEYSMNVDNKIQVTPVLVTNILLSERATAFAKKLGVVINDNHELKDYPRIKCNINRDEHGNITKIYHLPFDQQYDRTKINKNEEFFAFTVKEAVEKGFRRAHKHYAAI